MAANRDGGGDNTVAELLGFSSRCSLNSVFFEFNTMYDAMSLICGKINSPVLDIGRMGMGRWSLATTTTRYAR